MEAVKIILTSSLILGNILPFLAEESSNNKETECYHNLKDSGINDLIGILAIHNYYRNLVVKGKVPGQPTALSMKEIVWDQKLADKALEVAKVCLFKHNRAEDDRFLTGQNIHIQCSTNRDHVHTNWTEAITSWFNENKLYNYPDTTAEAIKSAGHYTQLVWANTEYVGCAYSFFKVRPEDQAPKNDYTQKMAWEGLPFCRLYVCNYGPGGNVVGSSPYEAYEI